MKDRFMKNGVFSLEYDKETLKDMVLELQEESQKQKEAIDKILNETKETRNILNNNRDDNMLSKSCLFSCFNLSTSLLFLYI